MRFLVIIALAAPAVALAQSDDDGTSNRKVRYAERTEIEFPDVEIESGIVKPRGITITEVAGMHFSPMFQPRTNFSAEMVESLDLVK